MSETTSPAAAPRRTARAELLPARLFARLAASRRPVRIISGFSFVVAGVIIAAIAFSDRPLLSPYGMTLTLFASLWLTPAIHLFRYASAIDRALASPDPGSIERVLRQQLRYWRFCGSCMLTQVAFVIIFVVRLS